ncbi:SHOCT domain-containing protein [Salinirubrum litoreum]|uniref:SHOCT domain-containing protein n=1 Tax=Salinirubrum litoreum TaxID=1126234 RepID=A0ABD5RDK1_9EURY|nr:SHOCT domain-containing protein [Salinirubrum litoreum]
MAESESDEDSPLQQVVGGLVTALTMLAAFGSLALGVEGWWIFFIVGFAGVMPLAIGLTKLYEARQESESASVAASVPTDADEDALATLRRRYAEGAIDEVEFERRVERLLETESVADAREYVDRVTAEVDEAAARDTDASGESAEPITETDRDR